MNCFFDIDQTPIDGDRVCTGFYGGRKGQLVDKTQKLLSDGDLVVYGVETEKFVMIKGVTTRGRLARSVFNGLADIFISEQIVSKGQAPIRREFKITIEWIDEKYDKEHSRVSVE